ncbi:TetR family transcriptional regulator [Pseudomonas sp. SJZ085]|uniref:transcriptional regulator, SarA/Rot family n=1 Tax=unclassified Pseudomonas TaxID=196821 RepID=UPI001199A4CC|nr:MULTISPECIES: TetR family transcriptional regulator [unclassified Pseudomonas]TWC24717.1 TetR family transcriptional regulator [Pseudomonas sp. SJZ074]TWC41066.1 TetR family transcriptional regulator [Pseudomonas sp. SJZ085]
MRYSPGLTAERYQTILEEASRLFRARGIAGASIAEVMKASGLTHGAFYAHFESKDALACASLERAMDQLALKLDETIAGSDAPKEAVLDLYLSERHRDHPEAGCAISALAIEVAREPGLRRSFTHRVARMVASFRSSLPWRRGRSREDQAIGFIATMVGAMVLARAVDDQPLSGRILRAARDSLLEADRRGEGVAIPAVQGAAETVRSDLLLPSVLDNSALQDASPEAGNQLSFALYSASNRMIRLHKPLLDPLGLTFPQYLVMLELFSEAPRSVGDLGARLAMDTGTITPLLKRLEASGKVTRTRDRDDERRVLIALTDAGEALREPLWAVSEKIKAACGIPGDSCEALRDTLGAVARPIWEHDVSGNQDVG